jgi:photosystem II stability/assembly factor-like uncharacterized protein
MKKNCLAVLVLIITFRSIVYAGPEDLPWRDVTNGLRESAFYNVAISPGNENTVYVHSATTLYKTDNGGQNWNAVLSLRGTANRINDIVVSDADEAILYAGTGEGLFVSRDGGNSWGKIFSGIGDLRSAVHAVAVDPDDGATLLIGTGSGLFRSIDQGRNWQKGRNLPSEAIVSALSIDSSDTATVYAAAATGLYKSINGGRDWRKIYENTIFREVYSEQSAIEEDGYIEKRSSIPDVIVDPEDPAVIYMATFQGLLISQNRGETWRNAGMLGLGSRNILDLAVSPADEGAVYAATNRGLFRYSKTGSSWSEIYKGLTSANISSITASSAELWVATTRGIFRTGSSEHTRALTEKNIGVSEILSAFTHEPAIAEIRQAAIDYADVNPDKINRWKKAAARKAWLPDLNLDYGRNKDWQSSTYFYSTSTQKYKDDDITSGDDDSWSVSLTWELGDLVWNSVQTSIDNRSKLMVQLRDDILNEVTRLYYERRRLQVEMLISPPQGVQDSIERELRLQELTAAIDALTGAHLSKRLMQRPETTLQ